MKTRLETWGVKNVRSPVVKDLCGDGGSSHPLMQVAMQAWLSATHTHAHNHMVITVCSLERTNHAQSQIADSKAFGVEQLAQEPLDTPLRQVRTCTYLFGPGKR